MQNFGENFCLSLRGSLGFWNFVIWLYDTVCFSIDFEAFGVEVEFGVDDIHEISDFFAFDNDIISVFSEHFVDEGGG